MAEDELCDGKEDCTTEGLGKDEDGHADGDSGWLEAVLNGDDGLESQSEDEGGQQ